MFCDALTIVLSRERGLGAVSASSTSKGSMGEGRRAALRYAGGSGGGSIYDD